MAPSLAYVLDDVFAEHQPPSAHPERPERLRAVRDGLHEAGLSGRATRLVTRPAKDHEIGLVHGAGYLADLERTVPGKSGWLDGDTYFSRGTWPATLAAAGAVIDLVRAALRGEHERGLAVIRPPGHHAEADHAMGFCLLNNVAIAAAVARAEGAARVAILDWDVHHGNGTQHIFERDDTVLYLSCHQYPYYPGTGACGEVGVGAGLGATVNVGMPGGAGDREYAAVFDEVFVPELRRFAPDILIVSAGFDPHADDPLADMRVTAAGFRYMADCLVGVADEVAGGRIVCALEGGYDLAGLTGGVVAVLDALTCAGAGGVAGPGHGAHVAHAGRSVDVPIASGVRRAITQTVQALAACRAPDAGPAGEQA